MSIFAFIHPCLKDVFSITFHFARAAICCYRDSKVLNVLHSIITSMVQTENKKCFKCIDSFKNIWKQHTIKVKPRDCTRGNFDIRDLFAW